MLVNWESVVIVNGSTLARDGRLCSKAASDRNEVDEQRREARVCL